ncbi:MAG: ATP-binding protein [Acidobacteriota bacterium]
MESLVTYFASPERASADTLMAERAEIESFGPLIGILEALPDLAAVLNPQRQFLYVNHALLNLLDVKTFEEVLGKRWGEAINCTHAFDLPGGCGTSEYCKCCGMTQAIVESQELRQARTKECRVSASNDGMLKAYDLSVTATPFQHHGADYTILTIKDISDEKRRRALEQIFFHDIINHAQSVAGLLTCAQEVVNPEEIREMLDLAHMASVEMMDGVLSQRDLLAAENGEIRLMKRRLTTRAVVEECASVIRHHFAASDRRLSIDPAVADAFIETDETLLKRILTNMIKNALEATPAGGEVVIGCRAEGASVVFWTKNPGYIPRDVQLQIFQRSYSTKGVNRGLGTYSMKLLGERYLGGKIWFTTEEVSGTTFFFELSACAL